VVDQLDAYYAARGLPVVFMEQYTGSPIGDRYGRFWAAFGGRTAYYPLVIVDSGHRYTSGTLDYNTWKSMIDAELSRPAQASIDASLQRVGNAIRVAGRVTNLSGVALSAAANEAEISVIVYEDIRVGVTNRYVRAVASQGLSEPLANGASHDFVLETGELSGVDWAKLHTIALIDYRPDGHSGAFDMLQAVVPALPAPVVAPASLTYMFDPARPSTQAKPLQITASTSLNWTISTHAGWLSADPASGSGSARPVISVDPARLAPGWQSASLTVEVRTVSGAPVLVQEVPVHAFVGEVHTSYMPFVSR
jgi:hypothetical protein